MLGPGKTAGVLFTVALSSTTAPGAEESAALLRAPFAAPRASFFHAALEVPPLKAARLLSPGAFHLRLASAHARSVASRTVDGVPSRFDGLFHEWAALEASWGALERLELSARAALSGWDEGLDRFTLRDDAGAPLVRDEAAVILGTGASKRHDNLSDLVLEAKTPLLRAERWPADLSLALSVKVPVGRARDLTNAGTTDLNLTLLGGVPLGPVTVHSALGGGFPLGEQDLFEEGAGVDLDPFLHAAVGATVLLGREWALGAQLEFNTSAFGEVEFLEDPPLTAVLGLRKLLLDRLVLEGGGGVGLLERSSYDWEAFLGVGYLF